MRPPEIATKQDGGAVPARRILHADRGGPQDMTGIMKRRHHAGGNFKLVAVSRAFKLLDNLPDVVAVVQRLNACSPAPLLLFIHIPAVVFLHAGGIFEHDAREIG